MYEVEASVGEDHLLSGAARLRHFRDGGRAIDDLLPITHGGTSTNDDLASP